MAYRSAGRLRYRRIIQEYVSGASDLAESFVFADAAVRKAIPARDRREAVILDVTCGVAGPILVTYTTWVLSEARRAGLRRLRFLSREGQVLFELARILAPALGADLDLEYVHGNRLTWNLAAADAGRLGKESWLFNGLMELGPAELCARLKLPARFVPLLVSSGFTEDGSSGPEARASALREFLGLESVMAAVSGTIGAARSLLAEYSAQHRLLGAATGIVDTGWVGRQVEALITVGDVPKEDRPRVLFWGYQPSSPVQAKNADIFSAYMYNTVTGQGTLLADAPFVMEMFCTSDHGTLVEYVRDSDGQVVPILASSRNAAAEEWGLGYYRGALVCFAEAVAQRCVHWDQDLRSLVRGLLELFWHHPTVDEAVTWGGFPYELTSDGSVITSVARPILDPGERARVDDPPWLAGSLILGDLA
ncbi:hypothetical protein [Streptosporangium sp. KLBMP 9127]|nr:hypothetical protein [Streptosporangium sp. KLBMP 9127]